jgi:outer membrane protein OmpA-like peptidoglycan-associated protein
MDGNPDLELDLPAWGATADHKDLFVEYDVENDALFDRWVERGLMDVQEAFSRAPVDAAGAANPDGQPGIRLWIDSPAVDPRLRLSGGPGQVRLRTPTICGVSDLGGLGDDENFYGAKKIGFDRDRRWVFRYGLKESPDEDCGKGGQAEIGGNDLLILNSDSSYRINGVDFPGGGTFMHELGHTLGLRHGGGQNRNRKPNYISLMNYRYSFTLQESGGDGYLDYSPAMAPGGSGIRPALMPDFNESAPPQGVVIGTGRDHLLLYPSLTCQYTAVPASDAFDLLPGVDGPAGQLAHPGADADMGKLPGSCEFARVQGASAVATHSDHDDWSAIRLPFQRSADADDGAVNPSDDEDFPDDDEVAELRELATTSDLKVTLVGPAVPVVVGTTARVTVTVSNVGGVHSAAPAVGLTVPAGVGVSASGAACSGVPLSCTFGPLGPGAATSFDLELAPVAAGPILVRGSVADAGLADSSPDDNVGEVTVTGVDPVVTPSPSPSPTPTVGTTPSPTPSTTPSAGPPPTVTPAPPTVTPAPPSATMVKTKVYFGYDSTKLTKAQKRKLRRLISSVPEGAAVSGDSRAMVRWQGARKSDRRLALTRAKKVRAYLYRQGLDGRVTVSNKGRTKLVTRKARRVNVTITYLR